MGYHTNLARLLESKPDSASPLGGTELVARKIRLLSVMAGSFGDAHWEGETIPKGSPEFNLLADVSAAQKVFSSWPTPIVDSGLEIGLAMLYPGRSVAHDYAYIGHHPIADTYHAYCEEMQGRDSRIKRCPEDHDHPTPDLTAVLYAARADRDYFSVSGKGTITVLDDGGSRFDESESGKHRYLIVSEQQKARSLEAMVMLASQLPVRVNASPRD